MIALLTEIALSQDLKVTPEPDGMILISKSTEFSFKLKILHDEQGTEVTIEKAQEKWLNWTLWLTFYLVCVLFIKEFLLRLAPTRIGVGVV